MNMAKKQPYFVGDEVYLRSYNEMTEIVDCDSDPDDLDVPCGFNGNMLDILNDYSGKKVKIREALWREDMGEWVYYITLGDHHPRWLWWSGFFYTDKDKSDVQHLFYTIQNGLYTVFLQPEDAKEKETILLNADKKVFEGFCFGMRQSQAKYSLTKIKG